MSTTINKQRVLTQLLATAPKTAGDGGGAARPVLEQFIYALCREGATREQADRAYAHLQGRFFDSASASLMRRLISMLFLTPLSISNCTVGV